MTANRLEAMREVVTNLLFEGQTSRADAVMELISRGGEIEGDTRPSRP